ncbi:hypothetical protein F5X99DRAFT_411326 [Biscogniauxia marginata]|nr:hypothetical protein F5X99DRAFT_411326 [Biscogniauxia marginata]
MCGCSNDDYEPQPSAQYQPSAQRPQHSKYNYSPEDAEKRRRQREATQAARGYGWPTERASRDRNHDAKYARLQTPGNRDSYLDPNLNSSLASMPDIEYYSSLPAPASYDPRRPRQPNPPRRPDPPPPVYNQYQHQNENQYQYQHRRAPAPPPYYQQQQQQQRPRPAASPVVVAQQPRRVKPMSMRVNTNPVPSRKPVPQVAAYAQPPQQTAKLERQASAVSECGSDGRPPTGYEVSPLSSPGSPDFPPNRPGQYGVMRRVPGRDGPF